MVESLLFLEAGAGTGVGAGEKNTQSRPKMDRLHNTMQMTIKTWKKQKPKAKKI